MTTFNKGLTSLVEACKDRLPLDPKAFVALARDTLRDLREQFSAGAEEWFTQQFGGLQQATEVLIADQLALEDRDRKVLTEVVSALIAEHEDKAFEVESEYRRDKAMDRARENFSRDLEETPYDGSEENSGPVYTIPYMRDKDGVRTWSRVVREEGVYSKRNPETGEYEVVYTAHPVTGDRVPVTVDKFAEVEEKALSIWIRRQREDGSWTRSMPLIEAYAKMRKLESRLRRNLKGAVDRKSAWKALRDTSFLRARLSWDKRHYKAPGKGFPGLYEMFAAAMRHGDTNRLEIRSSFDSQRAVMPYTLRTKDTEIQVEVWSWVCGHNRAGYQELKDKTARRMFVLQKIHDEVVGARALHHEDPEILKDLIRSGELHRRFMWKLYYDQLNLMLATAKNPDGSWVPAGSYKELALCREIWDGLRWMKQLAIYISNCSQA